MQAGGGRKGSASKAASTRTWTLRAKIKKCAVWHLDYVMVANKNKDKKVGLGIFTDPIRSGGVIASF